MTRPAWLVLSPRYGADVRNPSPEDLERAIAELFLEALPGIGESDYAEHGAASLRYGFDGGPMYVIEVDRRGNASFEEWADVDRERELAPPRAARLTADQALRLWALLAAGDVDEVRGLISSGGTPS
jgi:hypothetical protein